MAQEMLMDSKLRLRFDAGVDMEGRPLYRTKTFNNIHKGATADQLQQAGRAIGQLSEFDLVGIERANNYEIVNA